MSERKHSRRLTRLAKWKTPNLKDSFTRTAIVNGKVLKLKYENGKVFVEKA